MKCCETDCDSETHSKNMCYGWRQTFGLWLSKFLIKAAIKLQFISIDEICMPSRSMCIKKRSIRGTTASVEQHNTCRGITNLNSTTHVLHFNTFYVTFMILIIQIGGNFTELSADSIRFSTLLRHKALIIEWLLAKRFPQKMRRISYKMW